MVRLLARTASNRHSSRRQITIEQHFILESVNLRRRSKRLVDPIDLTQCEGRAPFAEDDRRDHDVQAIETARDYETRECVRAALDEHSAQSEIGETAKDRRRSDMPFGDRQAQRLDAWMAGAFDALAHHYQAANSIIRHRARARRKTPPRVDYDPRRAWSAHAANRQLRIVGLGRAHTDNDGVDEGAKTMQMREARRSIDEFQPPRCRRNTAIERLADLTHHDEVIDASAAERPEQFLPGLRKAPRRVTKSLWHAPPRVERIIGHGRDAFAAASRDGTRVVQRAVAVMADAAASNPTIERERDKQSANGSIVVGWVSWRSLGFD